MKRYPRSHSRTHPRKGAAIVEFAVCIPVIMVIVFGAIEAGSMLFLRQALVQSAYEGVRIAIKNDSQNSDAIRIAQSVATGRRIENINVTFEPANIATAVPGQQVHVTVSAPGDSNSLFPFGQFKNRTISAKAVMVKE